MASGAVTPGVHPTICSFPSSLTFGLSQSLIGLSLLWLSMARFRVIKEMGGWRVYKGSSPHYEKVYETKREAEKAARRAADTGESVQPQMSDGTWGNERTKNTFGPSGDR